MPRTMYTAEFKAKVVLEIIQGDEELGTIANKYRINPNMLRNWKKEFLENAGRVFAESKIEK
ncbi:MAG: transposase [Oscillospiraceae bacterium]